MPCSGRGRYHAFIPRCTINDRSGSWAAVPTTLALRSVYLRKLPTFCTAQVGGFSENEASRAPTPGGLGARACLALHAPDDARKIDNSLTYSLIGCILLFGLLRRGLSEDLFEAFVKSRSFFNSPRL